MLERTTGLGLLCVLLSSCALVGESYDPNTFMTVGADSNDTETSDESSESAGDGDGDSGDGDGDSGDGDGDSGDGDGDGDSGDGDGDSGDGDGDGDGDPNLCPDEPGDDACTLCVKDACCLELIECDADADCVCMRDCVDEGGSNNQCKNMCGVQGSNQNFQAYNGCVDDFCQADCG
jgi:hypothetical protein